MPGVESLGIRGTSQEKCVSCVRPGCAEMDELSETRVKNRLLALATEVTGSPNKSSFREVMAPEVPVGWAEERHETWRWRQGGGCGRVSAFSWTGLGARESHRCEILSAPVCQGE